MIIRKNINIDLAYTKMCFYKLFGGEKVLDSIKYPGWNQIDLHSHGLIDLMKDGSERNNNYTNKKFYDFVKEQGVKLKAVTNHNRFNFLEHIKHSIICSLY